MKKYRVTYPETTYEVEADNEEEAIERFQEVAVDADERYDPYKVEDLGEVED